MSCTICGSAHGHFRIKLSRRSTPTTSWSICPIQWVRWRRSTESRSREPIFSWACLTGTHSKRGETQHTRGFSPKRPSNYRSDNVERAGAIVLHESAVQDRSHRVLHQLCQAAQPERGGISIRNEGGKQNLQDGAPGLGHLSLQRDSRFGHSPHAAVIPREMGPDTSWIRSRASHNPSLPHL